MDNQQRSLDQRLYWLGGIFDGEGSFSLIALRRKGKLYSFRPQLSVCNTDMRIMDEVESLFKELTLPYHIVKNEARKDSQRPVTELTTRGLKRCFRALPHIIPYLIAKQERAEALFDFCLSRLTKEEEYHGQPLDEYEIKLVEFVRKENDARNGRSKPLTDYTPERSSNLLMI